MSKTQRDSSFPFSLPFADFQQGLGPSKLPIEFAQGLLKAQTRALDAMQAMTEHWFACRRQALDATLATIGRLSACKDATEMAETHQQWVTGASERLVSEITGLHDDVVKLTQSTASAVVESLGTGTPKKAA
ncbi:MAG: phasin family protein [Proteobacteria bacterium]|nr:phasin family protein [Pseudomonadota bacterium]